MIIFTALSLSVVAMILLRVAFVVLFAVLACGVPKNRDRHMEMRLTTLTFKFSDVRNDPHVAVELEPLPLDPIRDKDEVVEVKRIRGQSAEARRTNDSRHSRK
jgi:hypothetical protein